MPASTTAAAPHAMALAFSAAQSMTLSAFSRPRLPIADVHGALPEARHLDEAARGIAHHPIHVANAGEIALLAQRGVSAARSGARRRSARSFRSMRAPPCPRSACVKISCVSSSASSAPSSSLICASTVAFSSVDGVKSDQQVRSAEPEAERGLERLALEQLHFADVIRRRGPPPGTRARGSSPSWITRRRYSSAATKCKWDILVIE